MIDALNAWLSSGQDYDTGLTLARQLGSSPTLLGILSRGADAFTRKKLTKLLEAAAEGLGATSDPVLVAPQPAPAPVAVQPDQATLRAWAERDKVMLQALYNERSDAKATIRAWADDPAKQPARYALALRIKAITGQIDDLFDPPPAASPRPDPKLTIPNVRSYVSRYKKQLATCADADKPRITAKLNEYQTILTTLTNGSAPL